MRILTPKCTVLHRFAPIFSKIFRVKLSDNHNWELASPLPIPFSPPRRSSKLPRPLGTSFHILAPETGKTHLLTVKVKVKVWVLAIALLTRLEQQRFTISEVAADWHELMIPWCIMRPSIARDGKQLSRSAAHRHTTAPISALGLHPVARELLLISCPAEGRRLSWPEHTVG